MSRPLPAPRPALVARRARCHQRLQESHDLQQRLVAARDERCGVAQVPGEPFDQEQEEKRLLPEKRMMMPDAPLKLRSSPAATGRVRLRPLPGRTAEGQ